jgi:hypothetical protein
MTLYANTESLRKNEQVLLNLLKGLADEDTSISEKVYKFWDDANRLKDLPFERLRQLMRCVEGFMREVEKMAQHSWPMEMRHNSFTCLLTIQ